ncbi:MAG TPA: acyl-CoA dehydrogenase family protein, partial [Micromonosporaceae bacterium]
MAQPWDVVARLRPKFAARAEQADRDGTFPAADFADLRAAGLFGLFTPTHLGGLGRGYADYARVAFELARGNGATALVFNMHASVTGALASVPDDLVRSLGVPEEFFGARDEVLARAAAGAFYAVAMSERGVGSRLSMLATRYERVEGGFHVKGSKSFVSGAGHADAYLVAARSSTDDSVVSQFLVPADTAGLTVEPTWDSLGMRATASHDLHLDVVVPPTALLGGAEGLALLVAQLMPHWMVASYAAVYVGIAQSCVDEAVAHCTARGLAGLSSVRARLGRADAAVAAAR